MGDLLRAFLIGESIGSVASRSSLYNIVSLLTLTHDNIILINMRILMIFNVMANALVKTPITTSNPPLL